MLACRPTKLPGESQGQFRVTGTLEESTCGEGHPAPPSFVFYVELRSEGTRGYWKLAEGPAVAGSFGSDGAFRFEERVEVRAVEPDPPNGVAGCAVERGQVVAGTLAAVRDGAADTEDGGTPDAGAAPGTLRGTTTITVTPVPGGDCSPLLLPYGGAFPVLPCQIRYALVGERLARPIW